MGKGNAVVCVVCVVDGRIIIMYLVRTKLIS